MNSEQFRDHLKTQTFNYINRKYTEHNARRPDDKWSRQQMNVVERYVNNEINNFIHERGNRFPINNATRDEMTRNFLMRDIENVIFDPDYNDNPDDITYNLYTQLAEGIKLNGRKSKKSRKSRTSKKSRKSRKSRKTKKSKKRK